MQDDSNLGPSSSSSLDPPNNTASRPILPAHAGDLNFEYTPVSADVAPGSSSTDGNPAAVGGVGGSGAGAGAGGAAGSGDYAVSRTIYVVSNGVLCAVDIIAVEGGVGCGSFVPRMTDDWHLRFAVVCRWSIEGWVPCFLDRLKLPAFTSRSRRTVFVASCGLWFVWLQMKLYWVNRKRLLPSSVSW